MPGNPLHRLHNFLRTALVRWRRRRRSALSVDHVVWAYRLFLDREPEERQRIEDRMDRWRSTAEMRRDFMTSAEFHILERGGFGLDHEPSPVIKELPQGPRLFVDLSDPYAGLLIVQDQYELEEAELVQSVLQSGDTAVDLGANIGYFSILMAQAVGPEGTVYAFEPIPSNLALLRRSVEENAYGSRIEIVEAGVSCEAGHASFVSFGRGGASSGAHLRVDGTELPPKHEVHEAPLVALDHHPIRRPIHFIKADIEGSEPLAFQGASEILAEDRPIVLCELNPLRIREVSGVETRSFLRFMEELGYECCRLNGEPYGRSDPIDLQEICSVLFVPRPE